MPLPSKSVGVMLTSSSTRGKTLKTWGWLQAFPDWLKDCRRYQLPKFDALMVPFEQGVAVEVSDMMENKTYLSTMKSVPGLEAMVRTIEKSERPEAVASAMEFILEGLYVNKKLNKSRVQDRIVYRH